MALNRLAINAGSTLGPAVGGLLAQIDYVWLFWVDGSTCLLAALVLWLLRARLGAALDAAHAADTQAAEADASGAATSARSPLRDGPFLVCLLLLLSTSLLFFQLLSTLPLYFNSRYGLDEAELGLLFAVNPVMIIGLEMVLVHRLRHRAPLPFVALGLLCLGAGLAMLPLGTTLAWALLAIIIITFGEMLESPLVAGFVAERAGAGHRGRYMGLYTSCFALGSLVAPPLGLHVYDAYGGAVLCYGCGILGLLCAAGYLALHRACYRAAS